jgi:hypothetical protein
LHVSELCWRRLIDANVVGIVIADVDKVIDVNQKSWTWSAIPAKSWSGTSVGHI